MRIVPRRVFLTRGIGRHATELGSFERALRDAGISRFNLVEVSSIFPPHAEIVEKEDALEGLQSGEVLFVVLSRISSNEYGRKLAAAVGIAVPKDRSHYGYISEYSSFGETEEQAADMAEDLAAEMLASTLGVTDEKLTWDEAREAWRLSDKILLTRSIAAATEVRKSGEWTTAVAAAVLLP
ncbi:MAG TPA: arginine decarboxylase, pyruvoyl-dependent [Aciduliprofundum sp.]|nr:arginine decarboxylase, pyruvoyl-dependent [Thermoplasmata archaeon]HDJ27161.1 arginine decarboxylase, pyruvoyl-dependent [Aciduliprofundum sp.]